MAEPSDDKRCGCGLRLEPIDCPTCGGPFSDEIGVCDDCHNSGEVLGCPECDGGAPYDHWNEAKL